MISEPQKGLNVSVNTMSVCNVTSAGLRCERMVNHSRLCGKMRLISFEAIKK